MLLVRKSGSSQTFMLLLWLLVRERLHALTLTLLRILPRCLMMLRHGCMVHCSSSVRHSYVMHPLMLLKVQV